MSSHLVLLFSEADAEAVRRVRPEAELAAVKEGLLVVNLPAGTSQLELCLQYKHGASSAAPEPVEAAFQGSRALEVLCCRKACSERGATFIYQFRLESDLAPLLTVRLEPWWVDLLTGHSRLVARL